MRFEQIGPMDASAEPGTSFTWESRAPGVVSVGIHEVSGDAAPTVRVALLQSGPLAPVIGIIAGSLIRKYVRWEFEGLARQSAPQGPTA
jgi:hypothetical protein